MPKYSLVLCTARGSQAYRDHPEWDTVGKVVEMLEAQTNKDFELVVVDCSAAEPSLRASRRNILQQASFLCFYKVSSDPWRAVGAAAISYARNFGIAIARGNVIINLDDCCVLPPHYVEFFHRAASRGVYLVAAAPNDPRPEGLVVEAAAGFHTPMVYGFNSFPRELAGVVNGYHQYFDGGQGLEDAEFNLRMFRAMKEHGMRVAIAKIPGFDILAQTSHDRPNVMKCCNLAWKATVADVSYPHAAAYCNADYRLLTAEGGCVLYQDGKCAHHALMHDCAFPRIGKGTMPMSEQKSVQKAFRLSNAYNLRHMLRDQVSLRATALIDNKGE